MEYFAKCLASNEIQEYELGNETRLLFDKYMGPNISSLKDKYEG